MSTKRIHGGEGVSPTRGDRLRATGIPATTRLLEVCRTVIDRRALAASSGLTEKQILKFANMADRYRITGVGSEFAELLEAAGVDTVPELAMRNASHLTKAMADVSESKQLTRRVPTEAEVTKWVAEAKTLPRMLEY